MESGLRSFVSARDGSVSRAVSGLPAARAAASPPRTMRCLERFLPQLLLFALFFIFVGAILCLSIRSGSDEVRERRPKRRIGRGLDPATLALFRVMRFDEAAAGGGGGGKGALGTDCAVCLADFCGSDSVRVLPVCGHGFHAECIDPWFAGHATCPLCRNDLAALLSEDGHSIDITEDAE